MASRFILGNGLVDLPGEAMTALENLEWYGANRVSIAYEFDDGRSIKAVVVNDLEDGIHTFWVELREDPNG